MVCRGGTCALRIELRACDVLFSVDRLVFNVVCGTLELVKQRGGRRAHFSSQLALVRCSRSALSQQTLGTAIFSVTAPSFVAAHWRVQLLPMAMALWFGTAESAIHDNTSVWDSFSYRRVYVQRRFVRVRSQTRQLPLARESFFKKASRETAMVLSGHRGF